MKDGWRKREEVKGVERERRKVKRIGEKEKEKWRKKQMMQVKLGT